MPDMTITLLDAVHKFSRDLQPEDFWFLTGGKIPEDRRYGHRPERTQVDHFESRMRQVAQINGSSTLVIDAETLGELHTYSAAMASAIDQLKRLQDGDVALDDLVEWAAQREQDEAVAVPA